MSLSDARPALPVWDEIDLEALLTLDQLGPMRFRSRLGDPNRNGRSYGGQLLGQAMRAAGLTVPDDRPASMMQFLFLQGADPTQAIDLDVVALQDGKRFSSRRVQGMQPGGRLVLDAQVSFAVPMHSPEHAAPSPAREPNPDELPERLAMPVVTDISRTLGGYGLDHKRCMDFRVPQLAQQMTQREPQPGLRFWLKTVSALPDSQRLHEAAFAYLSDWWLNFSSLGLHVQALLPDRRLYLSSLNHGIWFHGPFRVDQWMHLSGTSPVATSGRGLSQAAVHDIDGRMIASLSQECLMAYA